ncbi:Vanillate O-demethylase oxidoreductase [Sphingomonas sp. Root710]|uniref:PDR/VanB family oxidoreductase n=1 Tax=Sphingomonas sp. Root710 TaxID=1736594 RepID=UPI0006F98457|nr:PDR/VanB family oxidoreductase [Sphingomonas sp. Root710]KRB79433.1 Vanillate O-demethylase oxidoreductase [Sphingomonas sp. Root710]
MSDDWITVRIAARRRLAEDVVGLSLAPVDGAVLPPFTAGAHVDLELPGGVVRQYSLCNAPGAPDRYELGVLLDRQGRGGSRAVHEALAEGQAVRISAPRNLFALQQAEHIVLMAGGIGITPILAMAEQLSCEGASFELHYFVRSAERAAFVDRLGEARFAGRWQLHVGERIPPSFDAAPTLGTPQPGHRLYICGPNGFMDFVLDRARAGGWAEDRLHSERFAAPPPSAEGDRPFELEIEGRGLIVPVAAGQSAAAALAAAGISIPLSCEQGICGTCLTTVAAGIPDHRDAYLSDQEKAANDCFTPCCSRAATPRLVIQL